MEGNCKHIIGTVDGFKGFGLSNDNDDFYVQIFETTTEINKFIKELEDKRDEVFKGWTDEEAKVKIDVFAQNQIDDIWKKDNGARDVWAK